MEESARVRGRVVVTGATGFIGAALCPLLVERGHEVAALTRRPDIVRLRAPAVYAAHRWDPAAGEPDAASFDGCRAVVHLAGESVSGRWSADKKRRILESRRIGTRHLVDRLKRLPDPPEVLVSASAIGYYGSRGDTLLDESSSPGEGFLADVCRSWEEEALRAASDRLRVVILRIGIVIGSGGGALDAMLLPFRLGVGGPLGNGRQWWSWVSREDVARVALEALSGAMEGPYNVTAPEPIRQREFARALGRVLRRPAFLPAPRFALRLTVGEFSGELLASARVVPRRLADAGYRFAGCDLDAVLRAAVSR